MFSAQKLCSVVVCDRPSTAKGLCKAHHGRLQRRGSPGKSGIRAYRSPRRTRSSRRTKNNRSGYIYLQSYGHPLAQASGQVMEHRAVLYDAIGPDQGRHCCWWCLRPVYWFADPGQQRLTVDHVNGVRDDNRLLNLVPSCYRCQRALHRLHPGPTFTSWP